jgi:hypothetical protein
LQTQKGKGKNVFEVLFCLSVSLGTSAHFLVRQRKRLGILWLKERINLKRPESCLKPFYATDQMLFRLKGFVRLLLN